MVKLCYVIECNYSSIVFPLFPPPPHFSFYIQFVSRLSNQLGSLGHYMTGQQMVSWSSFYYRLSWRSNCVELQENKPLGKRKKETAEQEMEMRKRKLFPHRFWLAPYQTLKCLCVLIKFTHQCVTLPIYATMKFDRPLQ